MFGRYTPSASNNNKLQEKVSKELTAAIYRLERGKYNSALDKSSVENCINKLKDLNATLSKSYGTGKEDVSGIADRASEQIKKILESASQNLTNRFEDSVGDLNYTIEFWDDVNAGYVSPDDIDNYEGKHRNRAIEKLSKKVEEYVRMEKDLIARSEKISKDIDNYSKDVEEYKRQIKEEYLKPNANATKIKQIYNNINLTNGKIVNTNKRQEFYSSCAGLISMICANVKNMLEDASYSKNILGEVTVYLENDAIANVFDKPGEVAKILENMNNRIDEIMKSNVIPLPTPTPTPTPIPKEVTVSTLDPQIDDFIKNLFEEDKQIEGLKELEFSEKETNKNNV